MHAESPICPCVHVCVHSVSSDWNPWTVAHQAPLSMEFPREEYWSGLLALPPWDLPVRDQTHISCISCIDRQTVYHWCHLGNPNVPQFSSVAQSCPTLCDPMNRSMPGLPVHHQLPEFTQTQVHQVSDAIQPSHPLSSPSPPAPKPSQHLSLLQ